MKIYSIYKATNRINNKVYIGFDSKWPRRMRSHKSIAKLSKDNMYFHHAIRKYGWDNFDWEIIYQSKDGEYTRTIMEPYFIKEHNSTDSSIGYNITKGGEGGMGYQHTEEHKRKMSMLFKGRPLTVEQKNNLSLVMTGRPLSIEHREKVIKNLVRNNPPASVIQKRAESCSKYYICISPNGVAHSVRNLMKFCRDNNLSPPNMYSLAKGKEQTHRGWKCFKDNTKV